MIYRLPVQGVFVTNCYAILDDETGHGFLIDPGAEGEKLVRLIPEQGWQMDGILLTHGHFDHTGGIAAIRRELELPVWIHAEGRAYLEDPKLNLSRYCGPDVIISDVTYFRDGAVLRAGDSPLELQVLHTPGHTRDSVVFYSRRDGAAFVGDTIFKGSPGDDRYPTGDGKTLLRSIRERILTLPEETVLLSGHSDPTTVGAEKGRYA